LLLVGGIIFALSFIVYSGVMTHLDNFNSIKRRIKKLETSTEPFVISFKSIRDDIEKYSYLSYRNFGITKKWLDEQEHSMQVKWALVYVKTIENYPTLNEYQYLMNLINTGVTYEEIKRTPDEIKALGHNALVQDTKKFLRNNTKERKEIIRGALKKGVTKKELQPEINAPCVDLEREEDK